MDRYRNLHQKSFFDKYKLTARQLCLYLVFAGFIQFLLISSFDSYLYDKDISHICVSTFSSFKRCLFINHWNKVHPEEKRLKIKDLTSLLIIIIITLITSQRIISGSANWKHCETEKVTWQMEHKHFKKTQLVGGLPVGYLQANRI